MQPGHSYTQEEMKRLVSIFQNHRKVPIGVMSTYYNSIPFILSQLTQATPLEHNDKARG